jgi:hypothetical protein
MGDWLPPTKPNWWSDIKDLAGYANKLIEFAKDPDGFIISKVATAVLGGIVSATLFVMGFVMDILDPVVEAVIYLLAGVVNLFDPLRITIETAVTTYNGFVYEIAASAGPAAPLVVVLIWGITGWVITRLLLLALQRYSPQAASAVRRATSW